MDYGTGADDAARADLNARHDESARPNEGIFADRDLGRHKLKRRMRKVVAPGAEISFLGDGGARADFNFTQSVSIRAIAQAGAVP